MTRDDIIRMAREAGFLMREIDLAYEDELKLFAELVAAAERERCAAVAEAYEPICDVCPKGVANAIRGMK